LIDTLVCIIADHSVIVIIVYQKLIFKVSVRLFPLFILDLFTSDEIYFFAYFIALIIQVRKITYLSNMFYTRNNIQ